MLVLGSDQLEVYRQRDHRQSHERLRDVNYRYRDAKERSTRYDFSPRGIIFYRTSPDNATISIAGLARDSCRGKAGVAGGALPNLAESPDA